MKKIFLATICFFCAFINGMQKAQSLHPDFTLGRSNDLIGSFRKAIKGWVSIDFEHLLTFNIPSLNGKSYGFHLANTLQTQRHIVSRDICLPNGCYQGCYKRGNDIYTSTFFPDKWTYEDLVACITHLWKYGVENPKMKSNRKVLKGEYKDRFGNKILALIVFDKNKNAVTSAYPYVPSSKTNKSAYK